MTRHRFWSTARATGLLVLACATLSLNVSLKQRRPVPRCSPEESLPIPGRHTTAMHLLQSNVDLNMIRSWLGHASIETTNGYVEIDLEMKRKTLQSAEKLIPTKAKARSAWQNDDKLLSWLSKL